MKRNGCFLLTLLVMLFMCGISFAQNQTPSQDADSITATQDQTQTQPKILSTEEIPSGFAAQIKKTSEQETVPALIPEEAEQTNNSKYPNYEAYLDSIEFIAKQLLPARLKLDSMKFVINEETQEPKGQYESDSRYQRRLENAEKSKEKRLKELDKQYKKEEEKIMTALISTIKLSEDIQPDWGNMLLQNETNAEEYQNRIDIFKDKISSADVMFARINSLLKRLEVSESNMNKLEKKNLLYVKRLERACDVMQNYMLQDQIIVLSTEKKEGQVVLGTYDSQKEEYQINVKDVNSEVPFDFYGTIKAGPYMAQRIDGKAEGFTASVDYINYPFVVNGTKVYPGIKQAHIYYQDDLMDSKGAFKAIDGYEQLEGYPNWAMRADSIISGKIKLKKLDASYAMKKVKVGPPFWTKKRIFIASSLVLSAASAGVAVWQDSKVKSRTKDANKLYTETLAAAINGDKAAYDSRKEAYNKKVDDRSSSLKMRNGLYISTGVFGVAGVATLFF